MITQSLKKLWTQSIARQLMLGIALVHAVLMTIFVIDLVAREKAFLVNLSREQAVGLAETLATNGTSWVLSQDFIGMEEIINSQSGFPGLRYAMFLDTKGKVLAYTDIKQIGKYVDDDISRTLLQAKPETTVLIDHSGFIDVATPILAHNQQIGWARVGISRVGITENIRHVTQNGLIYTIAAILIGTLFAWFMGRGLTKGLRQLSQATHGIINGEADVKCDLKRYDELGVLAKDFNGMAAIINDKEKALAENLSLLDALLNSIPDLVYYKDLQGKYLGCNVAFGKLVGVGEDEVIGQTDHDLFPEDVANFFREKDLQMLATGEPQHNEEWVDYFDGKHVLMDTLKIPFNTSSGELIGLIGISRDITLLKEQERQLRRSRKMDALGKLTGGVAHDYNNMLGIILGYAELLEEELADQPSLAEYASNILTAGKRGASLTRKLLTFSRSVPENVKSVDLNRAIEDASQMIEKSLTVSVRLELSLGQDLWLTQLDVGDFDNGLVNLCINAKHAMPTGGDLKIITANQRIGQEESHSLAVAPGEYVVVSVTDTGVGMSDETISKIFDPFFSTKGEMGTGLGLSQVYGFLSRSNGAVQVQSKLQEGSTFSLYFPRYVCDGNDLEEEQPAVTPKVNGKQTILVVDDEEVLCSLTQKIMNRHGYTTLVATSGQEALAILQEKSISLLITDIIMPNMNGHELAEKAQEVQPDMKVLFVSGYSEQVSDPTIERIQKPVEAEVLLERVAKILSDV